MSVPDFVSSLSKEELQHISENTDLVDAILHQTNSTIQNLKKSLEDVSDANIAAADKILGRETQVKELRDLVQRKLEEAHEAERKWKDVQQNMLAAIKPFSASALGLQLERALAESEIMSESFVQSFLDEQGPVDLAQFCKDYMAQRTTFHLRRERLARWKEGRVSGF